MPAARMSKSVMLFIVSSSVSRKKEIFSFVFFPFLLSCVLRALDASVSYPWDQGGSGFNGNAGRLHAGRVIHTQRQCPLP
jgi:hypothetical protein